MIIPLSNPDITEGEIKYINDVLRTPNLSLGPKLPEFEEKVAEYIGVRYAVAVNSGTSGLHLCMKALGIGEGDGVITTPFSFVASANCILFERARPVFVDIEPETLNIDMDKVEEVIDGSSKFKVQSSKFKSQGSKLKAILPVHVFGQPCEMDRILKVAERYDLRVIEDACEAIGAEYGGRKVGSFGDLGVFAFYPNKQITTGEGGMIVTDSEEFASLCRSMRNQGRDESGVGLKHVRLGYNYRMSEINCALGVVQLGRIEEILAKRDRVVEMYNERLKEIDGIKIPYVSPNVKMSWFVYVIQLEDSFSQADRDRVICELEKRGIESSNYFPPIHLQPFYVKLFGYKKGDFPIAERVAERTIALPFYNNLSEKEIDYICECLKKAL